MKKQTSNYSSSDKRRSPKGFEGYFASLSKDARAALESIRTIIKAVVPDAEEVISYQMPAFKHKGRLLVGIAAFKKHCSFFPMSARVMESHKRELEGFDTSKGTIRFSPDKPPSPALIRKLIRVRIKEIEKASRSMRQIPGVSNEKIEAYSSVCHHFSIARERVSLRRRSLLPRPYSLDREVL